MSFSHKEFNTIFNDTVAKIDELLRLKGGEYAGDTDRLANFRRAAEDQDLPMSTIWRIYAGKHWDAISQHVKDKRQAVERPVLEGIEGRVDDMITYLFLFKAILREEAGVHSLAGDDPFYQWEGYL